MSRPAQDSDPAAIVAEDFTAGFEIGVEAGLTVGWRQGWEAHDDYVQQRFGLAVNRVLDLPTQGELATRRGTAPRPCSARCQTCANCLTYVEWFGNATPSERAAALNGGDQ